MCEEAASFLSKVLESDELTGSTAFDLNIKKNAQMKINECSRQ
jgi:hypothetical protein